VFGWRVHRHKPLAEVGRRSRRFVAGLLSLWTEALEVVAGRVAFLPFVSGSGRGGGGVNNSRRHPRILAAANDGEQQQMVEVVVALADPPHSNSQQQQHSRRLILLPIGAKVLLPV
jgi:hypothetical protein